MDAEMLKHVSAGVMHYFREELDRTTVTVGEFAEVTVTGALEYDLIAK